MKSLGIIGFGNFGKFAALHLKAHFDVSVFDAGNIQSEAKKIGVKPASLEKAAGGDVVLLSVPVQNLEDALLKIRPSLKKDAIVLDVCSVKEKPAQLMDQHLPAGVQAIGTHPLFGPQSGKDGLTGLQIVICPIRADAKTVEKTRAFLKRLGLDVLDMTPAEHDEWMAKTQALAHYVGRAAKELDLPKAPFRLATYDAFLHLRDFVKDDSDALFGTIQDENPHAANERKRLRGKLDEIEKRLAER